MKLRGFFVVLETQVDKCSATPGWAVCGVTVFLAVPRYGQMTAGSYCYIGPQGIVHGTVVRSWGKLWQHLLEEDFSPGGWLREWAGLLREELLAAKEILIACSIKNSGFFPFNMSHPDHRREGICNQGLNLSSYSATICEVWIGICVLYMCYIKTFSWLFSLAVLCSRP